MELTMQSNSPNSLIALDRDHLIHPLVNYRAHEQRGVTILDSGYGAYLRDIQGNELLDAFSGLWCVNVGYGQEFEIGCLGSSSKGMSAMQSFGRSNHSTRHGAGNSGGSVRDSMTSLIARCTVMPQPLRKPASL